MTGLPTSSTGPNGILTSWAYDSFGRANLETRAANKAEPTTSTTAREFCGGSVWCPTYGAIRITTTATGAPAAIAYQDKLYRTIAAAAQSFDGRWVFVTTSHDSQGRVQKRSEPYFQNASTIYWTTIGYDTLGRPLTTTRPDGTVQSAAYNGLTVTGTNELGQTKTVINDFAGRMASVSDNAGNVTSYIYDATGQLVSMSGQGGTSTAAYDSRGNKTTDSDPDKGNWTYRYNALGLIYDPELGRFISADPIVQDLSNLQSWNRYSYVLNNPLSMTDPTGFFFGKIFKAIGNVLKSIGNAIGKLVSGIASAIKTALNKVPILRTAIQIVACGVSVVACVATAGALTLASGGSLTSALKAMAMSAVSIGVWQEVGLILEPFKALGAGGFAMMKGAVHGAAGGAMAVLQGASFLSGFAANAIGGVAGVFSSAVSQGNIIADTMIVAAAGGVAAELTGGKFANGALTAAFANMYNKYAGRGFGRRDPNEDWATGIMEGMGSVPRGIFYALRSMARGSGLLGAAEQLQWQQEQQAFDLFVDRYTSDAEFRSLVKQQAISLLRLYTAENSTPYMKAYFASRMATNAITGTGLVASSGDAWKSIENGHDILDALIKGGVLGQQ